MGIFSWIVMGLIAGAAAKLLLPGKDPGGWIVTILIGIAGALLGGYVGKLLGFGEFAGFNFRHFLVAVAGSFVLLIVYRIIRR